jgi:hypothetical protein
MSRAQEVIVISILGFLFGFIFGCHKPAQVQQLCMSGDVQRGTACVPPPEITKGKQ